MDSSSSEEEDDSKPKILISLRPAPSISHLSVPTHPIAVPSDIRKNGLSAAVNHLLNHSDSESIPFDFLLSSKLLRLPLHAAIRKEGLSAEHAVDLLYFPARPPPERTWEEKVPDWITAMDYTNVLFAGCADGILRVFGGQTKETPAHTGPIHCVSSMAHRGAVLVATGSMDQTLVTHVHRNDTVLHAVFSNGHSNSINSVALVDSKDGIRMASGDWDGGLALWNVPDTGADTDNVNDAGTNHKRRRTEAPQIHEVKPLSTTKAHSSNLSGISWGRDADTVITAGWDHGIHVYDVQRMERMVSVNGSRVITSMDRNGDVVGTGCADCTVRLWDMRVGGVASRMGDGTLRQSHKSWVSDVEWSPVDPFVLASTSHDGTLKLWDIRSSIPLHTVRAVSEKGEKALCLTFGDGFVYSGGSDCVVNKFAYKS